MNSVIAWMAAEAGREEDAGIAAGLVGDNQNPHPVAKTATRVGHPPGENPHVSQKTRDMGHPLELSVQGLPAHQFPATQAGETEATPVEDPEIEQERRVYRGRTVAMLRRYMRYSIETGRLPSLLGREFFRSKVTTYTVVTFEDRVIFVHDMEMCLERLDEFSRQIIARHILQEHDRWATARLLHCNEKTVRRLTPFALDLLSEIMLEVGLMERIGARGKKSCQGGQKAEISLSDCEDSENKV
ncbi:MAG: hypothetical protein ACLQBK_15065 [Candidatus Sulfotelmatobacter sp.]